MLCPVSEFLERGAALMGLFDWLKRVFSPKVKRDVSLLEGEGSDLDRVEEAVDLSGAPLQPGRQRITHRDPRLLPKRKPVWPEKAKRVMSKEEAGRFFAQTMRTRDRRIRDLLPDEAQLQRYGLPIWRSEADIAAALGISEGTLWHYCIHRDAEPISHYVTFAVPKRSGGERTIMAPKKRLKEIQRKLNELLVDKLPQSDSAHGFRKNRSIKTNAEPHVGKRVVLKVDLTDFFGTVTFPRVRGYLVALGYSYPVATSLAVLMTACERQPTQIDDQLFFVPVSKRYCVQGAPTSPGITNSIATKLDRRLCGLARRFGFEYTRYADDLTFSGNLTNRVPKLLSLIKQIIEDEGFCVNAKKTRIMRSGRSQKVTGVTTNRTLGLSRKERRMLRAEIHQKGEDPANRARIQGKLAYLRMLNPEQANSKLLRPNS